MSIHTVFKINDQQDITIKNLCFEANHIYRYDPIEIVFNDHQKEYILFQHDYLMPQVETFYYYLRDAIEGKLPLSEPAELGLGFLWNQDLYNTNMKSPDALKDEPVWEGTRYLMWGGNLFSAWLYNINELIFLEISPTYPWHFREVNEEEFTSYQEWIKNYKALCVISIDKKVAQQWLQKLETLMKEIELNDAKYLHKEQN